MTRRSPGLDYSSRGVPCIPEPLTPGLNCAVLSGVLRPRTEVAYLWDMAPREPRAISGARQRRREKSRDGRTVSGQIGAGSMTPSTDTVEERPLYHPLPPDRCFLTSAETARIHAASPAQRFARVRRGVRLAAGDRPAVAPALRPSRPGCARYNLQHGQWQDPIRLTRLRPPLPMGGYRSAEFVG